MYGWVIEQCFTSLPTQYRLYGRRFYRSKNPTNSIKVLNEEATKEKPEKGNNKIHIYCTYEIVHAKRIHIPTHNKSLVYTNMGRL